MVVDFALIQPHLQQSILKKCNFIQFALFLQCSQSSLAVSKRFKQRLPWNNENSSLNKFGIQVPFIYLGTKKRKRLASFLNNIPLNINFKSVEHTDYSDNGFEETIQLFASGYISTHEILFRPHFTTQYEKPERFKRLLKASCAKAVFFIGMEIEFLRDLQPELQTMSEIRIGMCAGGFPIDVLLSFTADKIELSDVTFTPQEINLFLKQWSKGSRNIRYVDFSYGGGTMDIDQFEAILEGIPHELIWSKDFHFRSVVSQRPIEEFEQWGERNRFYALKRGNAQLRVDLWENTFRATLAEDPIESFVSYFHSLNKNL